MRISMLCAAALAAAHFASPAVACEPGQCGTAAADVKPLQLKNHLRKPVASSAARTVKRSNGEYRKVALKRRAKPNAEAQLLPPALAPDAAQAYASETFANYELARVRVISPELVEETRLIADLVASGSTLSDDTSMLGTQSVLVVDGSEVNDIDLKADTPHAISLDALSRDLAGSRSVASTQASRVENETSLLTSTHTWLQTWFQSWLQRAQSVFGTAYAGLTTLVRTLAG